ncbi:MAG: anti-sigma factor [Mesorhizobium sp.]
MNAFRDPVVEADLDAYVDDQLDAGRRIEIEAYLSTRPDEAARVMADLRLRDELRLAAALPAGVASPATAEAARRLQRGLSRGRALDIVRRLAAAAVLIGGGWLAGHAAGPIAVTRVAASTPPPAYVEDAMRAHATTALRAGMSSQPAAPSYDADEIRAATAIVMPALPAGWDVRDVQVYPSRFGPSVEMAIQTSRYGPVSLFAVRPGRFDVTTPTVAAAGSVTAAYFQLGEVAYSLVAAGQPPGLAEAAERLAASLR